MKKLIISLSLLGMAGYISSASAGNMHEIQLDKNLRNIISKNKLTGDPLQGRTVPDIGSDKAQLGMDLFFSKSLGGDSDSACVACHHPALGGGDNLSLPIGVEADDPDLLGLGRTNYSALNNPEGGPPVPRNAPTTYNVVAWDKFQFHDGRVESLDKTPGANGAGESGIRTPDSAFGEADSLAGNNLVQAQARFPVTSNEEMKGFDHTGYNNQMIRDLLAGRLGGYGDEANELSKSSRDSWLEKFRLAFPEQTKKSAEELITEQNVSMVIAEYERSQAFVNTPWKLYIEDKADLSLEAKKGALLFYTASSKGGAGCSSCHQGDFFTDEGFHNLAMPQIGPGKGDGADGSKDLGRARETKVDGVVVEADKFAFRTPSLINVEMTGPWSHAGAYTTLKAVVKHHLDPAAAIASYAAAIASEDASLLDQEGIRNLDQMSINTTEALNANSFFRQGQEPTHLTDMQVDLLVEFLKSLTDPCTQSSECLSAWIPPVIKDNKDGQLGIQLDAYDQNSNSL